MNGRMIIAAVLIILGIGYTFDSIGMFEFSALVFTWWPILIIIFGIVNLSKKQNSLFFSLMIILVGIILQASKLDFINVSFWGIFWPLMLIMAGISLIYPHSKCRNKHLHKDGNFEINSIFGGQNKAVQDDKFTGGSISAVFGASEIDLSACKLNSKGAIIDITAAFGGVEIIIPNNWRVEVSGNPIFGAFDDKTRQKVESDTPLLRIQYNVIFGGIELSNY